MSHTPGPWFPHGFTYPECVAGDVFAKDSGNVLACTPICRVVEPVSKMDGDLRRPPLDALQAIARKDAARPIIEANARLIAAAPELLEALIDTLECAEQLMMRLSPDWDGTALEGSSLFKARAAIAKATGAGA